MLDWRNQDEGGLHKYKLWITRLITNRMQKGRDLYSAGQQGSKFQNDPLKHAAEEAGDLPFYIHRAFLQREAREAVMLECLEYIQNLENYYDTPEAIFGNIHTKHRREIECKIYTVLDMEPQIVDENV